MFPLGDMTKSEVKQIAMNNDLKKIAAKPESMGICFIGSRNFQDFIEGVRVSVINISNLRSLLLHNLILFKCVFYLVCYCSIFQINLEIL